jgi:hypothetical protein
MKSKSNPKGIRKGHWVANKTTGLNHAYKVSRVRRGKVFIIYHGNEFECAWTMKFVFRVSPTEDKHSYQFFN